MDMLGMAKEVASTVPISVMANIRILHTASLYQRQLQRHSAALCHIFGLQNRIDEKSDSVFAFYVSVHIRHGESL